MSNRIIPELVSMLPRSKHQLRLCFSHLRSACVREEEPEVYNTLLESIKSKNKEIGWSDVWKDIQNGTILALITMTESKGGCNDKEAQEVRGT